MKKGYFKKIILSVIMYIIFSILLFFVISITSVLRNPNNSILILFAVSLLRGILTFISIGLCVWCVYKIWKKQENKKTTLALIALLSPIKMYALWFVFVIICLALGADGSF